MGGGWQIACQVASRLKLLGIQDAPQKRRLADGPWEGGVYKTDHGKITKTVTAVKWDKGKALLQEMLTYKMDSLSDISYKRLEQVRDFLCHLSMVFYLITPYIKGFYVELAKHLPKRDGEG